MCVLVYIYKYIYIHIHIYAYLYIPIYMYMLTLERRQHHELLLAIQQDKICKNCCIQNISPSTTEQRQKMMVFKTRCVLQDYF